MNVMWMAALTYASALILLALAFSLMYKSTNVPNFATGTLMGLGAYASYTSTKIMKMPYLFGYPVSFITGAAFTGLTCLLIIEPMIKRNRTLVEITLATLGLMVLSEALTHIFDYWIRTQLHRS